MKISASIVSYNNKEKIVECIRSLYANTKEAELDLFVIDNASSDDTVKAIEEEFPQVTLIRNSENTGFGGGHNKVIPLLSAKYHAVINPDIKIDTDVLKSLTDFMEHHKDCGMITPRILNDDGTEQFLPKRRPKFRFVFISHLPGFRYLRDRYTMKYHNFREPEIIENCTGCFFVIRRALFEGLGGFDERFFLYFEDADLARRVSGYRNIYFYPDAYVYHGWQRDNVKSLNGIKHFIISYFKYTFKWLWRK